MNDTSRERILDAAEARARKAGYHGFSFRDVASDIGIKSASVHYHFPTKEDLAKALVDRYSARARLRLGDPAQASPVEALKRVVALFEDALTIDHKMCLCGLFGAERDALPQAVSVATAEFFRALLGYLTAANVGPPKLPTPARIIAQLEGALILARTLDDPELFLAIGRALIAEADESPAEL